MSQSKSSKVYQFMDQRVCEAVAVLCARHPERAVLYSGIMNQIAEIAASRTAHDPYRLRELIDICQWKQPPKSE